MSVLLATLAGRLVLGGAAVRELPKPYPLTAERTFAAAWLVAATGTTWWAVVPRAAPYQPPR